MVYNGGQKAYLAVAFIPLGNLSLSTTKTPFSSRLGRQPLQPLPAQPSSTIREKDDGYYFVRKGGTQAGSTKKVIKPSRCKASCDKRVGKLLNQSFIHVGPKDRPGRVGHGRCSGKPIIQRMYPGR
jgi:hypothetical protein